jgi:hypothetical protein
MNYWIAVTIYITLAGRSHDVFAAQLMPDRNFAMRGSIELQTRDERGDQSGMSCDAVRPPVNNRATYVEPSQTRPRHPRSIDIERDLILCGHDMKHTHQHIRIARSR